MRLTGREGRMKATEYSKKMNGFTTAEMLVVVAIITILAALLIPAIGQYQKDVKIAELDDGARSIFMAAQARLTAMQASSEAGMLKGEDSHYEVTATLNGKNFNIGVFWLTNEAGKENSTASLLPAGTIDPLLSGGCYVVEYDPVSGTVYSVFYAEKPFDYNDIKTKRTKSERQKSKTMVGYYEGGVVARQDDVPALRAPGVDLVNGEELVLKITVPEVSVKYQNNLHLDVTIVGEDKYGNSKTLTIIDRASAEKNSVNTVYLDTLRTERLAGDSTSGFSWTTGKPFQEWVQRCGIVPGCDITVQVQFYYSSSKDVIEQMAPVKEVSTNSLFASRSGSTVKIAYGRHLQNLDYGKWGRDYNIKVADSKINSAEQIRDIYFGQNSDWEKAYGTGQSVTGIYNGQMTNYNGRGYKIYDISIVPCPRASEQWVGLFVNFNGDSTGSGRGVLQNITLVDAKVRGKGWNCGTGTLAGIAKNTTFDNCQVYLIKADYGMVESTQNIAGGLVGTTEGTCTIKNSFASTSVKASQYVGGLVGQATNTLTIENSYAASYNQCTDKADGMGGLIGSANAGSTVTIKNSYAAGSLNGKVASKSYVGGLVGRCYTDDITFENCYAATEVCGLYARTTMDKNNTCYIYGIAEKGNNVNKIPYLGQDSVTYRSIGARYYTIEDFNKTVSQLKDDSDKAIFVKPAETEYTTPYNLCDVFLVDAFPYYKLNVEGMKHYGDWAWNYRGDVGIFYWEKHGEEYDISSAGWCDKGEYFVNTDHMCNDYNCDVHITEYGYGFYYRKEVIDEDNAKENTLLFNGGTGTRHWFEEARTTDGSPRLVSDILNEQVNEQVYGDGLTDGKGYVFHAYTQESMRKNTNYSREKGWLYWTESKNGSIKKHDTEFNWVLKESIWNLPKARPDFIINALINPDFGGAMKISSTLHETAVAGKDPYIDNLAAYSDSCNKSTNYIGRSQANAMNPYLIRNLEQLQHVNDDKSYGSKTDSVKRYLHAGQTTNDIENEARPLLFLRVSHNLSYYNENNVLQKFTPIGTTDAWFQGTFEGNGYRINDLQIESDAQYVGLFGVAIISDKTKPGGYFSQSKNKSLIDKITIESPIIKSTYTGSDTCGVGTLVGLAINFKITNCTVNNAVVSYSGSGEAAIGGLVGWSSITTVQNCKVSDGTTITIELASTSKSIRWSGLIGSATGTIKSCSTAAKLINNCTDLEPRKDHTLYGAKDGITNSFSLTPANIPKTVTIINGSLTVSN